VQQSYGVLIAEDTSNGDSDHIIVERSNYVLHGTKYSRDMNFAVRSPRDHLQIKWHQKFSHACPSIEILWKYFAVQ